MIIKKRQKPASSRAHGQYGSNSGALQAPGMHHPDHYHPPQPGWVVTDDETIAQLYDGEVTLEGDFNSDLHHLHAERRQSSGLPLELELVANAQQEAQQIRQEAAQAGYEEGLRQAEPLMHQLHEAIEALYTAKAKALAAASYDIAPIVMDVVSHILKTEAACDETLVLHMIKATIQTLDKDKKRFIIKVNPQEVEFVQAQFEQRPPVKGTDVDWYVEPDENVDLGSCMIETEAGMVDARFSTQLGVLSKLFETTAGGES